MSVTAGAYIATMPATYVVSGTLYIQSDNLLSSLTDIRQDGFSYVTPAQATMGELYPTVECQGVSAPLQERTSETKIAQVKRCADH